MRFEQPERLEEALDHLAQNPALTILAGGTDVVVHCRAGKLTPTGFLDISRIAELGTISVADGAITIGAGVTCSQLERSEALQQVYPLLCAAAASVGSPQIRTRASIGGNVVNASPAADLIPALTAAKAVAVIHSRGGIRHSAIPDLIGAPGNCGLHPGELLVAIVLQAMSEDVCWSFGKIGRRNALAIARINGACTFRLAQGRMEDVCLCIGAVTNRPMRFLQAEALLQGKQPEKTLFQQAGQAVKQEILAQTGLRESSDYKLPVSVDFTETLLKDALERGHHADSLYIK